MDNLQDELKELKGFIAELKADRAAVKEKEKREAWTKYVSLTVVIIAVVGSLAAQWSGKYSSRAANSQAQASDTWNLYQARSVKGHLLEVTSNTLVVSTDVKQPAVQKYLQKLGKDQAKYEDGKTESQNIARAFESDRDTSTKLSGEIAPAIQLFSLSIALASMCLLTKKKPLWIVAMIIAVLATGYMIRAKLDEEPLKGPALLAASQAPKPATEPPVKSQ